MNFSSNRLSSESSVNGSVDSFDEASSDDDLKELEKMIQFKKLPSDPYDLCIFAAAKHILKNSIATFPMLSLLSKVKLDAANCLVEKYLLIFTDDLFKDEGDVDPEGFMKYVPDDFTYEFCGRLARYNLTLESYLKSIVIPDIWKNRLSTKGIRSLCTMAFYRSILNPPVNELSADHENQVIDHHQDIEPKIIPSVKYNPISNQPSLKCKYLRFSDTLFS